MNPSNLLEMIFRRKLIAVCLPLLILTMGLIIALFFPRSYRSEARLFLQIGRESVGIDPTAQTGQQMISLQQQGRDSEVTSASDLLTSRGVIGLVVDRLGPEVVLSGAPAGEGEATVNPIADALDATLGQLIALIKSIDPISDREEAIIEIEKNLSVDAEIDSTILNLTYTTKTPAGAKQVLDKLIKIYQEEHMRIHRNTGSRSFFQEQGEILRTQLDESMNAIRMAKNEMGLSSINARRSNLENQLQSVQLAIYGAQTERSAAEASLKDLTMQLSNLPERMISSKKLIPNEGADLLREQLYALQVRKMDLKSRFSDTHPLVMAVSAQLEAAEEVVNDQSNTREETTDDVNPIHRQLSLSVKQNESTIAGLKARLDKLAKQEEFIRSDLEKLNFDEVRLAELERDNQLLSKKYFQYTENLEQARIDEALEDNMISSVSIAQKPTFAEKPVSPSKLLVGLGAIMLAFAGTGGLLVGLEQIDTKIRNSEVVEEVLDLPVLATIPDSSTYSRVYS